MIVVRLLRLMSCPWSLFHQLVRLCLVYKINARQKQILDAVDVLLRLLPMLIPTSQQPSSLMSDWKKAKLTPTDDNSSKTCTYCTASGHLIAGCPNSYTETLIFLGKKGHELENCDHFKNVNRKRTGKGRGSETFSNGDNVYRRHANNVHILDYDDVGGGQFTTTSSEDIPVARQVEYEAGSSISGQQQHNANASMTGILSLLK